MGGNWCKLEIRLGKISGTPGTAVQYAFALEQMWGNIRGEHSSSSRCPACGGYFHKIFKMYFKLQCCLRRSESSDLKVIPGIELPSTISYTFS